MQPPSLRFRALLAMQPGPMCCPAAKLAASQKTGWMQSTNECMVWRVEPDVTCGTS